GVVSFHEAQPGQEAGDRGPVVGGRVLAGRGQERVDGRAVQVAQGVVQTPDVRVDPGLRHGRADDRGDGAGARPAGAKGPGSCDQAVTCFAAQPARSVVGDQCLAPGRPRPLVAGALKLEELVDAFADGAWSMASAMTSAG